MKQLVSFISLFIAVGQTYAAIIAGDTIVIDFGNSGQQTNGANWNNATSLSANSTIVSNLTRFSDGFLTGVSLDISGTGNYGIDPSTTSAVSASFAVSGLIPSSAQVDFSYHRNNPTLLTLSGLDDALTYNISFLSKSPDSSLDPVGIVRNPQTWRINSGLPSQNDIIVDPDAPPYVHTFSNVVTNGSGNITLESLTTGAGPDAQHLNAMEITAIPEPSTLAFLVMSLGLLYIRKRRRVICS